MAKYTPHTKPEEKQMLAFLGLDSIEELFPDVSKELRIDKLVLEKGLTQQETARRISALSKSNKVYGTVLAGGGIEDHFIPPVVSELAKREEFVTAYTPYQPEISQGVLQSIFEYQTAMCMLTGMDASNASLYDGASALAEGIVMCCERKNTAVILGAVNPAYIEVVKTYAFAHGIKILHIKDKEGKADLKALKKELEQNDDIACVAAQCPNYYGLIEDMEQIGLIAKENNIKFIYAFHPIAAALLKTPFECGADVAVAEGQSLGLPMYYGGATLGIVTCSKAMLRRLPGRVVGQTNDVNGKRAFVLTLQAREQHIKRERALSSVCSNQALYALTASIYLSCVGKEGLKEIAQDCVDKAHYLAREITKKGGKLKYEGEFFHEFVTAGGQKASKTLKKHDILGGIKIGKDVLWCGTEKASKEALDLAAKAFEEEEK